MHIYTRIYTISYKHIFCIDIYVYLYTYTCPYAYTWK